MGVSRRLFILLVADDGRDVGFLEQEIRLEQAQGMRPALAARADAAGDDAVLEVLEQVWLRLDGQVRSVHGRIVAAPPSLRGLADQADIGVPYIESSEIGDERPVFVERAEGHGDQSREAVPLAELQRRNGQWTECSGRAAPRRLEVEEGTPKQIEAARLTDAISTDYDMDVARGMGGGRHPEGEFGRRVDGLRIGRKRETEGEAGKRGIA